uniref:Zinc metalloprotease EGY3, chloroplastic n=1 Tax=Musa acuminata subsp. malaccensis TaxID=214687 RepID=A0A804K2Z8_MUSAM
MASALLLLPPSLAFASSPFSFHPKIQCWHQSPRLLSPPRRVPLRTPPKFSARDQEEKANPPSSSVAVVPDEGDGDDRSPASEGVAGDGGESDEEAQKQQQEVDWKTDEEFKKFMGNPSIEAAIKLEKKRADRKLKELDRQSDVNPVTAFFKNVLRDSLTREKERLEKAEEAFKALDLNKLKSCFGYDTFFAVDVRRFGDGGIFIGNLRKPIEEVLPKLEKKLSEAAGREVVLWFMEETKDDITKQIATRVTAGRYGVKLSPSFLIPSNWTGCLGVMNNYESLLPNKKALFDIPVARTASAYLASLVLAITAFIIDGSFNGGDNALFIRPQFFYNNPLLSFVQLVIGPYADELGNVLPNAVEGVGVPVDPLAFAGLLGMVVTSLNLLPCGRLEGGRIAQALFGRNTATLLSFGTSLLLGIGGLSGSVLCLAWGLFSTFFRGGEELPARDEITPMGDDRYAWGFVLALVCFLTLFPNGGGTFSSSFFGPPYFRGEI